MASSNTSAAQSTPGLLDLEKELSCSICTDILYSPLTLLDCLHTFCGSCLKEWFHWQAEKEISSRKRDRTRRAIANPYTCPTCRALVRETRPNATVTTLLDMFSKANPGRIKTEDERREAEKGYKPGEAVMEKLPVQDESEDKDAEEYGRLMDEVLDRSMRELQLASAERQTRHRDRSRVPETEIRDAGEREQHRRRRSREARARGDQQATLDARTTRPRDYDGGHTAAAIRRATNQLDRASSVRISQRLSELEVRETEEDIMRQIVEDGLLDGIDVHNLDQRQEEEIADRIARAYRRRREQQARASQDQRVTPQESSQRSTNVREVSARQAPVPSAWQSREGQAARLRSSSQGGRRSAESGGRRQVEQNSIASASSSWQTRDIRQSRQRSSSQSGRPPVEPEFARRRPNDVPRSRSSMRSATDTAVPSGPIELSIVDQSRPSHQMLPSQTAHQDRRTQTEAQNNNNVPSGLSAMPIRRISPPAFQQNLAVPNDPGVLAPPRTCCSCQRTRIEYTLHHTCRKCGTSAQPYTLCHSCYLKGKGCNHWFGFGSAAKARFDRQAPPGAEFPHVIEPERYAIIQPQAPLASSDMPSQATMLERGVFCAVCTANSRTRYWSCNTCNNGEWGYCDYCVSHGRHCTHPLTPMTCDFVPPSSASSSVRTIPRLAPLTAPTPCSLCASAIPSSHLSWHCGTCNEIYCVTCRRKHLPVGLSGDNARRCPRGHRLDGIGPSSAEDLEDMRIKPPKSIFKAAGDRKMARVQALWTRLPGEGIDDELEFPKGAEITDVLDINGEWGWGVYCGKGGLFPMGYCRNV